MGNSTNFFNLSTVDGAGDSFADDDYKFSDRDRAIIDLVLHYGASAHIHGGDPITGSALADPPALALSTAPGFLDGGTTYYYKVAAVGEGGVEWAASPQASYTTSAPIPSPSAASLAPYSSGGSLNPGKYFYALSAWRGSNTLETEATNPIGITLPPVYGHSQRIRVTFPNFPIVVVGEDFGFNIYRRGPNENNYQLLTSVNLNVATPPTDYTDDGSAHPDCNRIAPRVNTSATGASVQITYPHTSVPDSSHPEILAVFEPGVASWRIYRTADSGSWASSFLIEITEPVSDIDSDINAIFVDTGGATSSGSPLDAAFTIESPPPIDLAIGTTGVLPFDRVDQFQVIEYSIPGIQVEKVGTFQWRCPVESATILDVGINLAYGSSPAADPLIVDVNFVDPTDGPVSLWTASANQPTIAVGDNESPRTKPDQHMGLTEGQYITVDVDQAGGGATPTDYDLFIQIRYFGPAGEVS